MFPVECVVRGYITGSGWKDYQRSGEVCGIGLPDGLEESQQLPEPIFTPATKAEVGDHDENVDFDRAAEILGDREALEELRRISIELYTRASAHARERGIILANTKFELGRNATGDIVLADEALTPDSSRFWPADTYEVGKGQPSFDKQYVRDWASNRAGTRARRRPSCPTTWSRARAIATARPTRRSPASPSTSGCAALVPLAKERRPGAGRPSTARSAPPDAADPRADPPKEGILDPQGQAVERALPALGFEGVANVHVGRMVELDAEDPARVPEMCERLLAYLLIEDYEVVQ